MQNAGQFGPGAASAHPPTQFVPSEPSPNGGSTTSSLRQFRKKDVDKNHVEPPKQMSESHVARIAPHNHYPPGSGDVYRYPAHQFPGYGPQVKYSDLAESSQPNPISTSVIQKPKPKDYMEMCNVQQQHLNNHPQYSPDNGQYMAKDSVQGYPTGFKQESHFFSKDQHQYQPLPHHPNNPKFNAIMGQNMRKYNPIPTDNPFFNKLSKLNPAMARSIINDHHLQETQPAYPPMDQRGLYAQQNHPRYYSGPIHQSNPYSPNANYPMGTPHSYANYQASSCSYPRPPQMGPRYPQMERSLSPARRGYPEGMHMTHMAYHPSMHQKMTVGPNYPPQYRGPEYSQHYQHRRMPQDCFSPQTLRPAQYMQGHHQISGQDMQDISESTVSPSDSLKKFIENWADEEPSSEINPMEANMTLRDKLRDDAPAGTVYMINATDVQYFENNGIPIVTSDNGGFQMTSENYQYLVKNGVVDNTGMVRIIEANKEISIDAAGNQERIVNLQIMEAPKSDCMMVSKHLPTNAVAAKQEDENRRVVIHQNTILNPATERTAPPVTDQIPLHQSVVDSLSNTKELVDKNCSPINLDHLEDNLGFSEPEPPSETEREPVKPDHPNLSEEHESIGLNLSEDIGENSNDSQDKSPGSKSMPIIDFFGENAQIIASEENSANDIDDESRNIDDESQNTEETSDNNNLEESEVAKSDEMGEEPSPRLQQGVIVTPINRDVAKSEAKSSVELSTKEIKEMDDENTENFEISQRRRKRIFSVDDIMRNIGNNAKLGPKEVDISCSVATVIEFLAREVAFSSAEQIDPTKPFELSKSEINTNEFLAKEVEFSSCEQVDSSKLFEQSKGETNIPDHEKTVSDDRSQCAIKEDLAATMEEIDGAPRFRNAFRVEGSSVLLQVAGELMEIHVHVVNGKKVINVTPLSDATAVVDCNDNYEMSANPCNQNPEDNGADGLKSISISDDAKNSNEELNDSKHSEDDDDYVVADEISDDQKVDGKEGDESNCNDIVSDEAPLSETDLRGDINDTEMKVIDEICPTLQSSIVIEYSKAVNLVDIARSDDESTKVEDNCPEVFENDEIVVACSEATPQINQNNNNIVEDNVLPVPEHIAPKLDDLVDNQEDIQTMECGAEDSNPIKDYSEPGTLTEPSYLAQEEPIETNEETECSKEEILEVIEEQGAEEPLETEKVFDESGSNFVQAELYETKESSTNATDNAEIDDEQPAPVNNSNELLVVCEPIPEVVTENQPEINPDAKIPGHRDEIESVAVDSITEPIDDDLENVGDPSCDNLKPMVVSQEGPEEEVSNTDEPDVSYTNFQGTTEEISQEVTQEPVKCEIHNSNDEARSELIQSLESKEEIFVPEGDVALETETILENHTDSCEDDEDHAESLDFPLEDEVFIAEPPAHEVIVSDPLEGFGVAVDSPEIPLELEPVTTTKEIMEIKQSLAVIERIEEKGVIGSHESKEIILKPVKPEVQILSPTSTNLEDPISLSKNNIYLEPRRKYSADNDVSEYTTPKVTTKAAKKLYESDLQVQHDIVSSSKKELPKPTIKSRKSAIKRSKRLTEKLQVKSEQKEMLRILADKRKRREELRQKELTKQTTDPAENKKADRLEQDEEYVDFKELLRARKLKKLKKLQEANKETDPLKLKISKSKAQSSHRHEKTPSSDCCSGCGIIDTPKKIKELENPIIMVKKSKKTEIITKPNLTVTKPDRNEPAPILKPDPLKLTTAHKSDQEKRIKKSVSFTDEFPSSTSFSVTAAAQTDLKLKMPSVIHPKNPLHPKDPRRRSRAFASHVMVPSVSELIEENGNPVNKKKISLADYVSRKRTVTCPDDCKLKEKRHKSDCCSDPEGFSSQLTSHCKTKALSDMKTSFVINSSDWEDSNSPAPTPTRLKEECLIQDFSGLIKNTKQVIDLNELTPVIENPHDRKLQEYKEMVDSQLSSLNIQIPKIKPHMPDSFNSIGKLNLGPYRSPESSSLVARFLNNEKLSQTDMEKIRKIINYKRTMQHHQKNGRSPSKSPATEFVLGKSPVYTSPDPTTYEIRNNSRLELDPKEMRLHLKKVNAKRKLMSDEEDSGSVTSNQSEKSNNNNKKNAGYSVFNRLGEDGLPKIIFKRNKWSGLVKEPVVELVKLNLDDLEKVKEKYNVTVRQMM